MAFEIQGLNKTFGEYKAVNDLNIRVEEGGILGIFGPKWCLVRRQRFV